MATFNYEEAVYAALCFIYGDDDRKISAKEQNGMNSLFLGQHYLSNESMEAISTRWAENGSVGFYDEVIDSLNECSYTEKLRAYRTICITLNDFSKERKDRWDPAHRIRASLGISSAEYDRFTNT